MTLREAKFSLASEIYFWGGLHPTRLFPCYNCYFVNPTPTHLYTSVYSQLYLHMSVRQSFCPQGGESHVTITHDAFDLTIQRLPSPAPSVQGPSWPRSCPTPSTWIFSTWTSSYKGPRHIQICWLGRSGRFASYQNVPLL